MANRNVDGCTIFRGENENLSHSVMIGQRQKMVRAVGIEPAQNSEVFIGKKGCHESLGSLIGSPRKNFDKGLKQILQVWPKLKKVQKEALLSLIRAFRKEAV